MSAYANYEALVSDYDQIRQPVGLDVVEAFIKEATGKKLSEIYMLDAGCGSGQYAEQLLKRGLGRITMLDASSGMLEHAKRRVEPFMQEQKVVQILEHKLPSLPFPDESFDVVMINQVLHHLIVPSEQKDGVSAIGQSGDYEVIINVFREVYRVLKSGGAFVLDTCSPEQLMGGYWYTALVPRGAERYAKRYPAIRTVRRFLDTAGFSKTYCLGLLDETLISDKFYKDTMGPTNPAWRCCDSFWAHLTPDELKSAVDKVNELRKQNTLDEFFQQREDLRYAYGQAIKILSIKQ